MLTHAARAAAKQLNKAKVPFQAPLAAAKQLNKVHFQAPLVAARGAREGLWLEQLSNGEQRAGQ